MRNKSFAIFILTHGRPHNIATLQALQKANCRAKIYIIIDNEDDQAEEYFKTYGKDNVIQFNKTEYAKNIDTADLIQDNRCILFARNYCWELAEQLGLEYFLQLDDDYTDFQYRYARPNENKLSYVSVKQFDKLCDLMIDFLKASNADTVAFAQGGDYIGGRNGGLFEQRVKRKAMNSFFCRTDRRITFKGRMNEDVTTYCLQGSQGRLFMTIADVMLNQLPTQSVGGGMAEFYKSTGTYLKTFYSVMFCPSFIKVSIMGTTNPRIHHRINWNGCCPLILNERWKKNDLE